MRLTVLTCALAIAASPLARAADITITGLDTGISPDQAKMVIGSGYTFHTWKSSSPHFYSLTAFNADKSAAYALSFADNRLWYIVHVIEFKQGNLPDAQTLAGEVNAKYGTPTVPQSGYHPEDGWRAVWDYTAGQKPISVTEKLPFNAFVQRQAMLATCGSVVAGTWGYFPIPDDTQPPTAPTSFSSSCYKVVVASYSVGSNHAATALQIQLVDDQVAMPAVREFSADQAAAQAAALKKAQAVKPAL